MKKIFAILFAIMGFSLCSCNEPNEPQPSIPEGDYIDRAAEFEKLEGWKFRCKVYAESQTIKDEGSQEEFMKKVDKLLADGNYVGMQVVDLSGRVLYSGATADFDENDLHDGQYIFEFFTEDGQIVCYKQMIRRLVE